MKCEECGHVETEEPSVSAGWQSQTAVGGCNFCSTKTDQILRVSSPSGLQVRFCLKCITAVALQAGTLEAYNGPTSPAAKFTNAIINAKMRRKI